MNLREFRIPRGVAAAVLVLSGCAAGAACGSGDGASGSAASSDAPEAGETSAVADAPAAPIDACTLIDADQVATLLGAPVEGRPTGTDPDMPGCIWENPQTYESVSVEIGKSDTAIDGTLPPPEPGFPDPTTPGPDGMRFLGSGSVEFAAAKRSNTVQVAVLSMLAEEADHAAVDLARQISSQLNG